MDNDTDKELHCHICDNTKFIVLFRKDEPSGYHEHIIYKCTECGTETDTHRGLEHHMVTVE